MSPVTYMILGNQSTYLMSTKVQLLFQQGHSRLIMTEAQNSTSSEAEDGEVIYHIRAERDEFVLGIQLLNPFHNYTTETLLIYDYREVRHSERIKVWNVTRDLVSFPTISSSYGITLR